MPQDGNIDHLLTKALAVLLAILVLTLVPCKAPYATNVAAWKGTTDGFKQLLFRCDWIGVLLCFAWGLSLMIATESGGKTLAWSSSLELLLLGLVVLLPPLFVLWEFWLGENGMLRVVIISNRNLASSAVVGCTLFACVFTSSNFLSVAYQALYNVPIAKTGQLVSIFVLGQVVGLVITTLILARWRYAQLLVFVGATLNVISTIGFAICLQLNGKIIIMIGSSLLCGIGMGLSTQTILAMVQSEFAHDPALVADASSCILL
jgi:hypothetical protein